MGLQTAAQQLGLPTNADCGSRFPTIGELTTLSSAPCPPLPVLLPVLLLSTPQLRDMSGVMLGEKPPRKRQQSQVSRASVAATRATSSKAKKAPAAKASKKKPAAAAESDSELPIVRMSSARATQIVREQQETHCHLKSATAPQGQARPLPKATGRLPSDPSRKPKLGLRVPNQNCPIHPCVCRKKNSSSRRRHVTAEELKDLRHATLCCCRPTSGSRCADERTT